MGRLHPKRHRSTNSASQCLEQNKQKLTCSHRFGTLPTRTFNVVGATAFGAGGLRAGGTRKIDLKSELEKAAFMATQFNQVILCAGLNGDWESEAANPNTGVIIQSGTPVSMPWANRVPALIHAWYGSNETGNAIADVVFGTSERRRTVYDEGVYIGYRFYEKCKRDVAFPFGHGLSYTTFELSSLSLEETGDELIVALDVHDSGDVDGARRSGLCWADPAQNLEADQGFERFSQGVRRSRQVRAR
ncbi:hypothetical protein CNMCM8694_000638 [Aspergillus lentulus]|nr:hypothetical protein CNMCM8060_008009 [Aspergillus lentulus]KAF4192270.1 hypothetical protein CNMCM8694_000638 [Aspergillus lentulus]